MIEFLQSVGAAWGIGAVFAILLFFVLMKVMKHYTSQIREDRKFMEDRMVKLTDDYNERQQETNKSRDDNTRILSELYTYLKAKNGGKH